MWSICQLYPPTPPTPDPATMATTPGSSQRRNRMQQMRVSAHTHATLVLLCGVHGDSVTVATARGIVMNPPKTIFPPIVLWQSASPLKHFLPSFLPPFLPSSSLPTLSSDSTPFISPSSPPELLPRSRIYITRVKSRQHRGIFALVYSVLNINLYSAFTALFYYYM